MTPNWTLDLPGFPYAGDDPDGFLPRDEIVGYLEAYAASFDPPYRSGVEVTRIAAGSDGWVVETSEGALAAPNVVAAIGTFRIPRIPAAAVGLPETVTQVHSSQYRNPHALPAGGVLVVGSGQSGGQIAEDLFREGREVWIALGSAPRVPRRYRGRDTVAWLVELPEEVTVHTHPMGPAVRRMAHPHVSGRDGGKDINFRHFAEQGMHIVGHVERADGSKVHLRDDVVASLDQADAFAAQVTAMIDEYIEEAGIDAPADDAAVVSWSPQEVATELDLDAEGITSVVWATGFEPDFSVIDVPIFDAAGYPEYERGVTDAPGLYFVGLHWLHTQASALFYGVGADAGYVVDHLAARLAPTG